MNDTVQQNRQSHIVAILVSAVCLISVATLKSVGITFAAAEEMPKHFQECPQCPQMVVVPAGHFSMTRKGARDGRKDDDPEGIRKSQPARDVEIPAPFGLAIFPVTRGEFGVFVNETHRKSNTGCHTQYHGVWILDGAKNWQHPGFEQTDREPVVCVSLRDAEDYIGWLNTKVRTSSYDEAPEPYRLPTWEEVEYAAGGGRRSLYYWGEQPRRDQANFGKANCLPCGPLQDGPDHWLYTSPVGSFPPNPWGLYDMAGNVWQWARSSISYPYAILHGGSWLTNPEYLRTGERSYAFPGVRSSEIGFRIARTLSGNGHD